MSNWTEFSGPMETELSRLITCNLYASKCYILVLLLMQLKVYGYDWQKSTKYIVINDIFGVAVCDRDAKHSELDRSNVG